MMPGRWNKKGLAPLGAALGLTALIGSEAEAAPPSLLPVQGLVADADGVALDGPVDMVFSLYDSPNATEPLWMEFREEGDEVDVRGGYFSVYLGEIEPLVVEDLLFANELWLGFGVADSPEVGRVQVGSVAYALMAGVAETAVNATGDITPRSVTVGERLVIDADGNWVGPSGWARGSGRASRSGGSGRASG